MDLSKYRSSELLRIKADANLTEDEELIFDCLSKGKTIIQISDKMHLSTRTIDRRIRCIKDKIK